MTADNEYNMPPRRFRYEGRVIDGPWEGKMHSSNEKVVRITVPPPMSVMNFDPYKMPEIVTLRHCLYIWSRSLRGWCFDWGYYGYYRT